jgi:hypothetical protein
VDSKTFPTPEDFWKASLTQESQARAEREMARIYAGENEYRATYEIVLPSGEARFVFARGTAVRGADDQLSYLYGLNLDLTEQTLIERENSKLVAQLREAQAIAHVGSWSFDLTNQDLTWSRELYKIYEISEQHPRSDLYERYRSRVHPDDWPRLDLCIRKAMETGEGYVLDYRLALPDGRIKHVQGIGKVTFDQNGKPCRLGGTCRDRSQEAELQRLLELERAKTMQSAKLSSLGELSAGVAHEINNPLAIITGTVELLMRNTEHPRQLSERVEAIRGAAQRIAKIVKGLKTFARSDEAAVFNSHSLGTILEDALVLVGAKAKSLDTRILTDIKSDSRLTCDNLQIEQVLINLISNSIDAVKDTAEKWVKVTMFEEGNDLVVRVIDSGPGISEEVRAKLFTPFFTTKKIGEGTGLGLTISKGILDAHGATIELNAAFNNTCFEIRFKRNKALHGA